MHISRIANERGGALVMAMIFITALSIMTLGFMQIATATKENSSSTIVREQAYRMAEASLADFVQRANKAGGVSSVPATATVNYLNDGDSPPNPIMTYGFNNPNTSITSGVYTYYRVICWGTVTGQSAGSGGDSSGNVTRYLEAWVRSKPGAPGAPVGGFPAKAFGKSSASTSGNSSTDSFNSALVDANGVPLSYSQQIAAAPASGNNAAGSLAAFQASPTGGSGNVGSNLTITVNGAYSIAGNLNPGPNQNVGGSPPGPAPSGITGKVIPLAAPIKLPDPTAITTPPASGATVYVNSGNVSASNNGGTAVTMPSVIASTPSTAGTDGKTTIYHVQDLSSGFSVYGNVVIYLDGGVSLSGKNNFVSIYPHATLTIYQSADGSGGLDIHGSPGFQQVDSSGNSLAYQLPNLFNFISSSTGSEGWHGNSDFAANVYAPNAPVDFTGNGNRLGAVIADALAIGGGSTMHEDLNATSPAFATPPTNPLITLTSSREVVPLGSTYVPLQN